MLLVKYTSVDVEDWQNYQDSLSAFREATWHTLDAQNWADRFPYFPSVRFQVAYTARDLILHYEVMENGLRANAMQHNEAVWQDSCVECFISFDAGESYYNIEFNLLGAGLIGFGGRVRKERQRLASDLIDRVSTFTSVQRKAGKKTWQMVLAIPFDILGQDGRTLSGMSADANFYKCGDHLPEPHYLSWKPIESPDPSFHLPDYFGKIRFE